ncbi:uncharacterized protein M421DRAFT_51285 [Didymella exigua CBS 183.55]|uniref:EGF-like domain-containing protein n=1 Tax=Didymella exigua CBS 183.55 TaxID=1150837 RepID=A0A6A5S9G3_9PLEO|nr:uncharacterized protein M421DRAFT_51285 [Didymella exigua CBS 183.55]KAF1934107.1 hypothetical protein M421DRAFT_51285 [Didymella exigua CBS 183.55]
MSFEPTLAPRAYGDAQDGTAQKGSVRAARERMQAAQMRSQLPDTSKIIGLPQRPNQLVSHYATSRDNVSQPRTPTDRRDDESMPSPPPQWPLPDDASPTIPPRSPHRLRPPQSTIRPISEDYPIQQLSPGSPPPLSPDYLQPPQFNLRISNKSTDMYSPTSRPFSGASEASSLGSIPDFPVPQPPMPTVQPLPRRVPSLGPPPSSRRGPSSYYTQMSYVSPIVEESEARSDTIRSRHGSYASSNVFPMHGDDFYQRDYPQSDDDETILSDRGTMSPASDHNDESGLVKESPTLVRQASLGRRTKPSLMTIKSVDGINEKKNGNIKKIVAGASIGAAGAGGFFAARDMAQGSPLRSSILSSGTGLIDPSPSSPGGSLNSTFRNTKSTSPSYTGAESPIFPFQPEPRSNTLAERVGFRRPPRLDMDTVRDAEARGSLTSLPDLIRRATRLAANLDRGRTASRLGLDFWEAGAPEQKNVRKSQNSLTDMLAAFPPPGQETPQRSDTPAGNAMAEWPSSGGAATRSGGADQGYSNEKPVKNRRRCCGLPLWTFITLLIVLLVIIAAAVIIPIVLVVIPNQNKSTNAAQDSQSNNTVPSAPAPTSGAGGNSDNCQNGGVAIQNGDQSTTCVCINGFTGSTCSTNDQTGCTTTSIMGTANNATVGSGIPRIVQSATEDFNVPLNATRILSLFSSLSLSCAAENALITFNGLTSRSVSIADLYCKLGIPLSTRSLPTLLLPHLAGQVQARQDATPISSNTTAVDFARVGVLFALQQDGKLDTAATAQESVQDFLTGNRNGNTNKNTVDIGPFTLDLVALTIKFDNGTTIGAKS